jgi:hypothetical protein
MCAVEAHDNATRYGLDRNGSLVRDSLRATLRNAQGIRHAPGEALELATWLTTIL